MQTAHVSLWGHNGCTDKAAHRNLTEKGEAIPNADSVCLGPVTHSKRLIKSVPTACSNVRQDDVYCDKTRRMELLLMSSCLFSREVLSLLDLIL